MNLLLKVLHLRRIEDVVDSSKVLRSWSGMRSLRSVMLKAVKEGVGCDLPFSGNLPSAITQMVSDPSYPTRLSTHSILPIWSCS